MLTSNFNSWDKGVFSVIGKPGGPSSQDFTKPKHFYLRDDEAVAKFDEYGPTDITYNFNKFGFRSDEFVDDGRDAILSIGDSFTICIGVPYEHSWPYILSKKFGDCKNYNLGLSAVSGDYIVRAVSKTIEVLKPKAIFVFWPGLSAREIPVRNRYLPFQKATVLGEEQIHEPVFDGLSKFVFDNSYIIYQHRKNVEFLRAICKVHKVPCQELSMCTYNKPIESVNIAEAETNFDMSKPSEIQNPPGYEQGFTRTSRDGIHLGHEWNKHIAELFYSQYKYNI